MSYGFAGYIGLAKETNWGSAQAATDFVEALTENLTLGIDRFPTKNIIGTMAEPDDAAGLNRVSGQVTFSAHPVSIGHFLRAALRPQSTTVVASGALWTHEFTSPLADFASGIPQAPYTLEIFRDVTTAQQYGGAMLTSLALTFAANRPVECTAAFLARNTAPCSKQSPTFPSSSSKPFTFDTVSMSIGGSGTVDVEELTVTIDNNLTGFGALNQSRDIAKIRRSDHQMVNINGTVDFTTLDEYEQFRSQNERRMTISVTKADSFQMTLDMPRVIYTAFPLGTPGRDRITVGFTGKAFYHSGSQTAIKATLTTVKSNY